MNAAWPIGASKPSKTTTRRGDRIAPIALRMNSNGEAISYPPNALWDLFLPSRSLRDVTRQPYKELHIGVFAINVHSPSEGEVALGHGLSFV